MMKQLLSMLAALFMALLLPAAEKLAVAEPVAKGGITPAETEAVWSLLEASAGGSYDLISRSALKTMLTEIGLVSSSGLTELDSVAKAKLGEVKTVRYLLVTTVARIGNRISLAMMVIDASTGEIDPGKRFTGLYNNFDDLADRLEDSVKKLLEAPGTRQAALLAPAIRVATAPPHLAETFGVQLENALLKSSIRLQNLRNVRRILDANRIGPLDEIEPALYARVGKLLEVPFLIQPTINRCSITRKSETIAITRQTVTRHIGAIEGEVRIIASATGELLSSEAFQTRVDFSDIPADINTDDWTPEDYLRYLIDQAAMPVAAKLAKTMQELTKK